MADSFGLSLPRTIVQCKSFLKIWNCCAEMQEHRLNISTFDCQGRTANEHHAKRL
jgi:hypothetical protein